MTDNETKKALECCVNWKGTTSCADCPLHNTGCVHFNKLKEVFDLINRLEEKNSNLTSNLTSLQNDLTSAKAEIERLKKSNESFADMGKMFSEIKAEAVKEFAEIIVADYPEMEYYLDNLVKRNGG